MPELRFTQDEKQYTFNPDKITTLEAIELKKLTGLTVMEWSQAMGTLDAEAFRALVWLARKRAGDLPEGRYSEFDFPFLEVANTFEVEGADADDDSDPTPAAI